MPKRREVNLRVSYYCMQCGTLTDIDPNHPWARVCDDCREKNKRLSPGRPKKCYHCKSEKVVELGEYIKCMNCGVKRRVKSVK